MKLGLLVLQSRVPRQSRNSQSSEEVGPSWSASGSAAVTVDAVLADEARLREQFQQLWDASHIQELLVKRLRDYFSDRRALLS